ncbi:MAG: TAXI family TRAP transporter solute-binding subunit [Pararhodobacter sp.]|nr:TAXI family TRAP transporter solute-binding subunit [Pararhodobacter sp.]
MTGLAFLASLAIGAGGADAQRMSIGTNPQGSLYYVVGGGMAALLSEQMGRQTIAQPYGGASVYLPLIANGEVTMGLSSSLDSGRAYSGSDGPRMPELRALARLWPLDYAFMVRGDSGLETIADLRGRRVAVEVSANAALAAANRAILASAGLTEADVEAETIGGLPQGVQGVVEGTLDATAIAVGIPLTLQAHASLSGGIRYLSLEGDDATSEFLDSQLSGLYLSTIEPSESRPGVAGTTNVTAFDVFLIVSADMSDDDAAQILQTLSDGWAQLAQDYPALRGGAPEMFSSPTNTVPYHPGAVAFFQQAGIWTDENAAREADYAD